MARKTNGKDSSTGKGGDLGFEAKLWQAADKLRSNMDASEYKHVVLGLIFLKYISDAFEESRAALEAERDLFSDPEDPDEYRARNAFWVPREARGVRLGEAAHQSVLWPLLAKITGRVTRVSSSQISGATIQGFAITG